MSAVAQAHAVSLADAGHAPAVVARTPQQVEATEMNRWMLWFGTPVLIGAIFVGITFGTGAELWLSGTLAAIIVDIFILVWLALSSDTNGVIGESSHHH